MEFSTSLDSIGPVLQICVIDLLLSGDNAILIAMACRALPETVRRRAILLGTAAAVALRVILTFAATLALRAPYLKLVGAVLLLLIAMELIAGDADGRRRAERGGADAGIWRSVMLIVVADVVMSLDNVIAIAAAAQDSLRLLIFGLLLSVPILVFSSLVVARLLDRFPLLVVGGGAMLGWIAGKTAVSDPVLAGTLETQSFGLVALAPVLGALYVVVQGRLLAARRAAAPPVETAAPRAVAPVLRAAPVAAATREAAGATAVLVTHPGAPRDLAAASAPSGAAAPLAARQGGPPETEAARAAVVAAVGPAADLPAGPAGDATPGPAATGGPRPMRRLSAMDMTIMAGVAVPVLGLLATLIYIVGRAIAAH